MAVHPDKIQFWSKKPDSFFPQWTYDAVSDAVRRSRHLDGLYYEIVPQGSYVNKTNIRSDSDVDLVVELKMPFQEKLERLTKEQEKRFLERYERSLYEWHDFHQDVLSALNERFWLRDGSKCIDIRYWDSMMRLPADVVPALEHREYSGFTTSGNEFYNSGIFFYSKKGEPIISYPVQHLENGEKKDRNTGGRYKQVIRVFKNARKNAEKVGIDVTGTSSYLIECALYNVLDATFQQELVPAYVGSLGWLLEQDEDAWARFLCQNEVRTLGQAFEKQQRDAAQTLVATLLGCMNNTATCIQCE